MSARLSLHPVGLESLDTLEGLDALCVFVGEDERPLPGIAGFADWRLRGRLSRLLQQEFFRGTAEDCLLVPTEGVLAMPRLFAVGLGQAGGLRREQLIDALVLAGRTLKRAGVEAVALELPGEGSLPESVRAELLLTSFLPAFGGKRVAVLGPGSLAGPLKL